MRRLRVAPPLLGVLDQGISSLSNVAATIAVAREADTREFGAFGVAMGAYLLTTTVNRGVVNGPVSIQLSQLDKDFRLHATRALAASFAVGVMLGLVALVGSAFANRELRSMLIVLAISGTVLLVQDSLRQLAYANQTPLAATFNSGAWLSSQLAIYAALYVAGSASPAALAAAWSLSSLAGVLVGLLILRLQIRPGIAMDWFRAHGRLIRSMSFEYLLIAGVAQGAPLLIGAIAGLPAIGATRAALTVFGPLTSLSHGLAMAMVPAAARKWKAGMSNFHRSIAIAGAVLGLSCVLWGFLMTHVPDSVGESLFAESWEPAKALLILVGLWLGLGYMTEPAVSALRIARKEWVAARLRSVLAPLTLALCAVGALRGGDVGAVVALVIASSLSFLAYWQRAATFSRDQRL